MQWIIIIAIIVGGIWLNSSGIITAVSKAKAEEKEVLDRRKRGKTQEQKDIIDFLYIDPNGCNFSNVVNSDMTIQDYEQIVARKLYNLDLKQSAVSSRFSVTWIFFSKTQMYTYTYTFETISDNVWETTRDFFYQDVTCMTMQQRIVEKIDSLPSGCFSKKEAYVKNNFLVDTLEIVVPGADYTFSMRNNEDLERSLKAAKAMLRERKYVH